MRFSNNKICFLKNIDSLPDVLIIEIYEYIPKTVKLFLTKENYLQYHYLLKEYINKKNKNIEKYFRTMVRQDNDFVFQELLVENYKKIPNVKMINNIVSTDGNPVEFDQLKPSVEYLIT